RKRWSIALSNLAENGTSQCSPPFSGMPKLREKFPITRPTSLTQTMQRQKTHLTLCLRHLNRLWMLTGHEFQWKELKNSTFVKHIDPEKVVHLIQYRSVSSQTRA
ncbi:hypothetical protein PMAYCL1PPCAC_09467, partial [Pristionchus mayeri]